VIARMEYHNPAKMDRCAVFVDAGWFLSEAALAMTGRGSRRSVECDYRQLMLALAQVACENTRLPLLRIYWYDAAPDGIPAADHLAIASLGNVKLRLGRISHHEQKGVDALLILDLTTLARERAIASAVVISGDEDIREGIVVAQSLGVRVTLGAVSLPEGRPSLATTLLHEADDQVFLDSAFLGRCLTPSETERQWATPVRGSIRADPPMDEVEEPRQYGFRFGTSYADSLSDDELRILQRGAPDIPSEVAAQLFRGAEELFGSLRGKTDVRRELRAGFWDHVMRRRNN
jgi:uncharacterized LabA/DUF88 family protein